MRQTTRQWRELFPYVIGLVVCLSSSVALAAPDRADNSDGPVAPSPIAKGKTEWGLLSGVGIAHAIWDGAADRQFLQLGGRLGRVLTDAAGPGPLKGHFEISLEVLPVMVVFQKKTAYAASTVLLFRHYLAPGGRLRPFISFGAGALFSTAKTPAGTSRINFSPQTGMGVSYRMSPRAVWSFEYRLHHISNADLAKLNPGINSSYFQFGVSLFR